MVNRTEPIRVNNVNSTVTVPHWGITLRRLFGAAIEAWPNPKPGESRDFTVIHKDARIATITVQQHDDIETN